LPYTQSKTYPGRRRSATVIGWVPGAKTNVDEFATPLEEVEILDRTEAVRTLRKLLGG